MSWLGTWFGRWVGRWLGSLVGGIFPAGTVSLPLARLRNLILLCPSWTGTVYIAEAPAGVARPFVVLSESSAWESSMVAVGHHAESGEILMLVECGVLGTDGSEDAGIRFRNFLGTLIEEMTDRSGPSDSLWIRRMRAVEAPRRAHPSIRNVQGDFYRATLSVSWGMVA